MRIRCPICDKRVSWLNYDLLVNGVVVRVCNACYLLALKKSFVKRGVKGFRKFGLSNFS